MSEQDRTGGRAGDGLPEPEQGTARAADDAQEVSGLVRRFRVANGERTPRLIINNSSGAVRVRGGEEGNESIALRAVKPNGEVIPLDLIADVDLRFDGEIVVKARPFGDVQRQVRRITKSLDFNRADFLDNLGDMIETLAQMKTVGRTVGQVQLEATVPSRCDLEVSTASGGIQVQGVTGEIELKSASGRIETRQLGGKLAARTASGDVRVDGVDGTAYLQSVSGEVDARGIGGDVVIHTTSGDTRAREITGQLGFKSLSGELAVERSRLNGFYINTTSGECSIDAHLEPGGYEVRTVSGELSLRVQPDFAGVLSGRTVSGAFRCDLPYRYADDNWRSQIDDDDDRGQNPGDASSDDETEISLPGIKIGKGRVELPGIKIDDHGVGVLGMRIDDHGIDMPGLGVHIGKGRWDREHWGGRWDKDADREQRRERRRSRNRWEFLIGDPATAEAAQTRLRIRSVSGSVSIRQGRGEAMGDTSIAARAAAAAERAATTAGRATTTDRPGWPDSELWPSASAVPTPPTPPTPPNAPMAPMPPAIPTPPTPPTPPVPPTPSGEARSAAGEADIPTSASPVADSAAGDGDSTATTSASATDVSVEDVAVPAAEVAPVAQVANPERTRLDILEALERGEINADDALRLLRRLEI